MFPTVRESLFTNERTRFANRNVRSSRSNGLSDSMGTSILFAREPFVLNFSPSPFVFLFEIWDLRFGIFYGRGTIWDVRFGIFYGRGTISDGSTLQKTCCPGVEAGRSDMRRAVR